MQTTSPPQRPRILLAEDDATVRYMLRRIIDTACDVIAEADDGQRAVDLAIELRPDLVLLDVSMPVVRGFDAARAICRLAPEVGIIMVSSYSNEDYVQEAFRIGVKGYVLKGSALYQLPNAIRSVLDGKIYHPD